MAGPLAWEAAYHEGSCLHIAHLLTSQEVEVEVEAAYGHPGCCGCSTTMRLPATK